MSVVSSDFIENTMIRNLDDITKKSPVLQKNTLQNTNTETSITSRGFMVNSFKLDGIPLLTASSGVDMNAIESVEVLSGLSGFLYGAGNVGGTINYVLKRPTATPFAKVSVGNNGGENYFTSVDTSQNITDKLSVRVNAKYEDGDTVKDRNNQGGFGSIALDYKPTDDLDLGLYASYNKSKIYDVETLFSITGENPKAYDTSKSYAPDFAYSNKEATILGANASYNFTDNLHLRTAYFHYDGNRDAISPYMYINSNTNTYTRRLFKNDYFGNVEDGVYAYLDSEFDTGSIQHSLTFGGSVSKLKQTFTKTRNYKDPITYMDINHLNTTWNESLVNFGQESKRYVNLKQTNTNVVLGDNCQVQTKNVPKCSVKMYHLVTPIC